MNTLISVHDLLVFAAYCTAITAGVLLVRVLLNLNRLLKSLNDLVNRNNDSVSETISALPATLKQINDIAAGIKTGMDKVKSIAQVFKVSTGLFSKKKE